ncbi:hypothetical protein OH693_08490 [Escherichia coli]|nr:hypothetical protein [Escherichia coli]
MDIEDLTKKVKELAAKRTDEERLKLLVDAKILTKNGTFNSRFFSKETVAKKVKYKNSAQPHKFDTCTISRNINISTILFTKFSYEK